MSTGEDGLLPVAEGEPKPWLLSVWRYHHEEREPFVNREDAIGLWEALEEDDGCHVEGLLRPDGSWDEDAERLIRPWNFMGDKRRYAR